MKKVKGNISSDANISRLCEEIAKLDEEIAGRNRVTPTPAKVMPTEPQRDLAHLSETLQTAVREMKAAQQQLAAKQVKTAEKAKHMRTRRESFVPLVVDD